MTDRAELKRVALASLECQDASFQPQYDAEFEKAATPGAVWRLIEEFEALIAENRTLHKNAERYLVLRQADVDTIQNGGLFAGLTPDNIVINGHDLDDRVDALIAARMGTAP
ncbi:hypothetical protein [Pseudomonas lurida]|uniref:hypothetical protein n=1 Tax=Pseudomonas lurida TaxID=244566 RepID=UPI00177E4753|nr:hypothetical protein [Pseudomonas lurida]MBD8671667.1 hypothetical protein [Pseudomonas lurida]